MFNGRKFPAFQGFFQYWEHEKVRGFKSVKTVGEESLLCFCRKIQERHIHEQVHCHDVKAMKCLAISPKILFVFIYANAAKIQDNMCYWLFWQELIMHHAIVIDKKIVWKTFHLTNLDVLFSTSYQYNDITIFYQL